MIRNFDGRTLVTPHSAACFLPRCTDLCGIAKHWINNRADWNGTIGLQVDRVIGHTGIITHQSALKILAANSLAAGRRSKRD